MPVFVYKAKNRVGNLIEGERTARNVQEVMAGLEKDQLIVVHIERKKGAVKLPFIGGRESVKLKELSIFNRQLSVMFNAGLPITQSLGILATQQKNLYFKKVLEEVRRDVEAGSNFSVALKKHPKVFNDLYHSLVQAGEASGNLDTILVRISEYLENTQRLVGKVKSAMAYPIAVIVIAVVLTGVILTQVVPVFSDMFKQMGATLPTPTQLVIDASDFLTENFLLVIAAIVGMIFALKAYNKTFNGKRRLDKLKLRIPVLGDLLLKTAVARTTRTMSTLLTAGVEIIESLGITAKTAGNAIVEDAILRSRMGIQEGRPVSESWEEQKLFPFMVTQMIGVGEQTGSLSTMLGKIADFYDEEVEAAVNALVSLMEPIMIVVLGGLVGGIIIAMYLPMFDMIGKIG